jgi:hypothetical protein
VKRDLASTCADGVRKKAKYLQDAYDSQQVAAEQAAQGGNVNATGMDQQPLLSDQDQQQRQGPGGMEGKFFRTFKNSLGEVQTELRTFCLAKCPFTNII